MRQPGNVTPIYVISEIHRGKETSHAVFLRICGQVQENVTVTTDAIDRFTFLTDFITAANQSTLGTDYLKSLDGIQKIIQLVASLIGLIIMILSGRSSRGTAFIVAAIGSIIASCIFILVYVTGKPTKKLTQVELNFAYVWGVFYLVVSGLVIATMVSNYVTAGVFGLIATITYFWDGYEKYNM